MYPPPYPFLLLLLARRPISAGAGTVGGPTGNARLALTDRGGLTRAIEFYLACREVGVKPILGLEIPVNYLWGAGDLVLLAMNIEGWRSLCRLSSTLQTTLHRDPERGLSFEHLTQDTEGLICLTGGKQGLIADLLALQQLQSARTFLGELTKLFPGRLYIKLHIHSRADQSGVETLAALALECGLPVVVTNDVHFLRADQVALYRLLTALRQSVRLKDLPTEATVPEGAFFASSTKMAERFAAYPQAVAATLEIAERCNLELPLGIPHYPALPLPPGKTALELLRERAYQGTKQQYGRLTPEIRGRLQRELAIIGERGYAPLFLIMAEILDFARREGVPTASRGSASSSLVAHCLGITAPDPLAHNLYFERFLNPARTSPPDIDTDLCSTRREKVLKYVYTHYGVERVAMVATIQRLRGRSALREVAKAYGLPAKEIKALTEALPYLGWNPQAQADDTLPYAELQARFPQYAALFREAATLLEFPRHLSVHPGGVVIASSPLTDLESKVQGCGRPCAKCRLILPRTY